MLSSAYSFTNPPERGFMGHAHQLRLLQLADEANTNRSRMVEYLVMRDRSVLEASAVISRRPRRRWRERLPGGNRGPEVPGPGLR